MLILLGRQNYAAYFTKMLNKYMEGGVKINGFSRLRFNRGRSKTNPCRNYGR